MILIIFTPYLLYIHRSIPSEVLEYKTYFGTIKAGGYLDVQIFIYIIFEKATPLLLLILWFLTNKNWWVHALVIPITVYLFQFISAINSNEDTFAENEFIYTIPIALIILLILYYLRSKLSLYIQAIDLKKEMDEKMSFPKE
ncbi:hypothetical protein SAMN05444411_10421 [Lutibacter oricola]|uniref:Uncharacterized protein n=2 Tax=Lutibacter oricola TaxID=762486 RepID=A0A1H3A5S0_9FLAO|nr:hypothetical protein SAMN05444411_10421 [Lutibacter oricola]